MSSDFNQPDSRANDSQAPYASPSSVPADSESAPDYLKRNSDPDPDPSQESWIGRISFSGVCAWLIVFAITGLLCTSFSYQTVMGTSEVGGDASPMDLFPVQMQGKALVGQEALAGAVGEEAEATNEKAIDDAVEALDTGPYEQRLGTSIIINELKGPGEAIDYLEKLDEKVADNDELELTEDQKQLRETLGRMMNEYESGQFDSDFVSDDEKELLSERLQWLGELALVPEGTSDESGRSKLVGQSTSLMITAVVGLVGGVLLMGAGLAVAIVLLVFLSQGTLKAGFENQNHNHNIYIETFAFWMLLFFGSSIGLGFLGIKNEETMMFLQPVIFFGSLFALVWPVVRGISFAQVRQDIGWTCSKPIPDAGTSVLSYLSTLPLMIPAFACMFIMMSLASQFNEPNEFARSSGPSHPIQEYVMSGNATMIALIFVAVCVCAPVVEETMFRGVLYRHLRDLTGHWQRSISVIFAAIFNGVIFASCHPQGIFGIPLLATLAVGFSFAREWRGSLISPMIMHAIHNGLLTCMMLFIL